MKNKFYKMTVTVYVAASSKQMARNILAAQLDGLCDDTVEAAYDQKEDYCGVTGWFNMGRPVESPIYEDGFRTLWGDAFEAAEERYTVR